VPALISIHKTNPTSDKEDKEQRMLGPADPKGGMN